MSRLGRIYSHLRRNGIGMVTQKIISASGLRRLFAGIGGKTKVLVGAGVPVERDTLYAFYDLNVNPITFDTAWFCVGAELERRARGLAKLELIAVPGDKGGVRDEPLDYEAVVDRDSRVARIYNVVLPCMLSMQPAASVHFFEDPAQLKAWWRAPENVYPKGYNMQFFPTPFATSAYARVIEKLCANGMENFYTGGIVGRRAVDKWRESRGARRRLVVITLRQYGYVVDRNGNIQAWLDFARGLDPSLYSVVFVPDTDTAFGNYVTEIEREFLVMREAAFNMQLRTALYESAYLNMSTLSGATSMFVLNARCRYLLFKISVPSAPMSTEKMLRDYGFTPGETPAFAAPFQKWVWESDDLDVLRREFETFERAATANGLADTPELTP
jgi:hypothetical protein